MKIGFKQEKHERVETFVEDKKNDSGKVKGVRVLDDDGWSERETCCGVRYIYLELILDTCIIWFGCNIFFCVSFTCYSTSYGSNPDEPIYCCRISQLKSCVNQRAFSWVSVRDQWDISLIDLKSIPTREFDVIVGIDWLRANKTQIICSSM